MVAVFFFFLDWCERNKTMSHVLFQGHNFNELFFFGLCASVCVYAKIIQLIRNQKRIFFHFFCGWGKIEGNVFFFFFQMGNWKIWDGRSGSLLKFFPESLGNFNFQISRMTTPTRENPFTSIKQQQQYVNRNKI